jgi:hypothetical protein
MLTKPAIVQEQRQSEFVCSACGAARDCRCDAPALERLAAKQEQDRQRSRAYRERSVGQLARAKSVLADNPGISAYKLKQLSHANIAMCRRALRETTASRDASVENIGKSLVVDDDDDVIDEKSNPEVRQRAFWYRVLKAKEYAENDLSGLEITKDMLEAADAVISAWTKLRKQMERSGGATISYPSANFSTAC